MAVSTIRSTTATDQRDAETDSSSPSSASSRHSILAASLTTLHQDGRYFSTEAAAAAAVYDDAEQFMVRDKCSAGILIACKGNAEAVGWRMLVVP